MIDDRLLNCTSAEESDSWPNEVERFNILVFFNSSSSASTTSSPSLRIKALLQIASTSCIICVDKIIVAFFESPRISSLTKLVCFGSRPFVGSSKMSNLGLPKIACAIPTRCLYPRDSVDIWERIFDSISVACMTLFISDILLLLSIPLISQT